MKIIAIGDIHGCSRAFDALLEAIELQGEDRLITLGDYVDRGADSKGVLDRLGSSKSPHYSVSLVWVASVNSLQAA